MKTKNYLLPVVFALFSSTPAFAVSFGGAHSYQVYSCLGIDGVPISGGTLETECCSNGSLVANPPDDCRAGFYSISGDAATNVAFNIQQAQKTLSDAQQMTGATVDFNNVTASTTAPATGGSLVEASAATAGVGTTSNLGANTTTDPTIGSTSSGSGSGSAGGGGAGSGGAAGGLDTSLSGGAGGAAGGANSANGSGANALTSADAAAAADRAAMVAYASNNGGAGKSLSSGFNGFGGGSGNTLNGKSISDANLNFGDGKNGQANAKDAALDEDAGASDVDPEDYFKKIDQSANLFKVVSNRYFKKKSLWKQK